MSSWQIEPIKQSDNDQMRRLAIHGWGSETMVVHDTVYNLTEQEGFLARSQAEIVGMLTYRMAASGRSELLSLDSVIENQGIGSALLDAYIHRVAAQVVHQIYLVTTNDNLRALEFYQKRGFTLSALHLYAVTRARKIKPEIPIYAENGIAIEHELELTRTIGEKDLI